MLLKTPSSAEMLAAAAPFTADCAPRGGKAQFYICTGGMQPAGDGMKTTGITFLS